MEPEEILQNYSKSAERWLIELSAFDPTSFYQPGKSGWSVSEVVDHICKTTDKCLELALLCSEGKGEKGRSGFGAAVFSWMG